MKHSFFRTLAPISVVTGLWCVPAMAFSNGSPEGFSGGPSSSMLDCAVCHADFEVNSGPGSIGVLDLPALYVPDKVYVLRVRVEDPSKVGAGFEISVEDPAGAFIGELAVIDTVNTDSAGSGPVSYITHTSDGKANSIADWSAMGSAAEFTVQWKAPPSDAGAINFYAAGNAINNGTASSGDEVYTTAPMRLAAAPGDLNGDGVVDTADLGILIGAFGTADPVADINNDGIVDTADLGILIGAFGS